MSKYLFDFASAEQQVAFAILVILFWGSESGIALIRVPHASFGSARVFAVGLILTVGGQLPRWWSIATLGRLFTVNVAIRENHRLIDKGPYRLVRHPSYTALLLVHAGAALCFGNALTLAVLTIPVAAALFYRMRVEEAVLVDELGPSYLQYMTRTRRLIPLVY